MVMLKIYTPLSHVLFIGCPWDVYIYMRLPFDLTIWFDMKPEEIFARIIENIHETFFQCFHIPRYSWGSSIFRL